MREKIWGVLAAGALGDAMGMPTECWSHMTVIPFNNQAEAINLAEVN